MKCSSLNSLFMMFLILFIPLIPLDAQTILVHSASMGDQADETVKIYSQSAEAGIMDVLYNRGCIVFSDMSEADESGVLKMAKTTGSEFIISWSLVDAGLRGTLVNTEKSESIKDALVGETELEDLYNDPSELYSALGSRLCESLVGDRW